MTFDLPAVLGGAVPPPVEQRCSCVHRIPALEVFSARGEFAVTFHGRSPALWINEGGTPVLVSEGTSKKVTSGEIAVSPPDISAASYRHGFLAIIYDDFTSFNYCHWLVDWLPRLHSIQVAGFDLKTLTFLFPWKLPAVAKETLAALGATNFIEKLAPWGRDPEPILFDGAVVLSSSFKNFRHCFYKGAPQLFTFMRTHAPSLSLERRGSRKLFIDRKGPGRRALMSDDVNVLSDLGFETVFFEGLTLGEQLDLVRSASHIVSVHGAGLANTAYAEPGTKLLEIFSPYFGTPCFFEISKLTEVDYACIQGLEIHHPDIEKMNAPMKSFGIDGSLIREWFESRS